MFGVTLERVCDFKNVGGGMALLILNEKQQRVYASWEIPDSINYKPMPPEKFKRIMEKEDYDILPGRQFLKSLMFCSLIRT